MPDLSQVNWARAQFALTAMFHWIFVPLTLGLSFLLAFFETWYVKTGKKEWKRLTRFWMKLFAVNFAIGIATGLILEFEFGTNWANYSWMVGDIFGAPLAVEGIFAFFLEATFFAVMFFGWDRVSKRFHLFSTWMVAIGSNLSALWILVANGWMQHPVGMRFNPDSARFEMEHFGALLWNSTAITRFGHATAAGFLFSALFVIAVSAWFLLRHRHQEMAIRSIIVAGVFGFFASAYVAVSGDESAYTNAAVQPMKLAAMEALYNGEKPAHLVIMGVVNPEKRLGDERPAFLYKLQIPILLSVLAKRNLIGFVPGIEDLVHGNRQQGVTGVNELINRGRRAVSALTEYREARRAGNQEQAAAALAQFNSAADALGYGYLLSPEEAVPPVRLIFYSFRAMVLLGGFFTLVILLFLYFAVKGTLEQQRWLLRTGILTIFLGFVASELGWVVAEVGRQPWAIQGLLPVTVANSQLTVGTVQASFYMFLVLFTVLLLAEVRIMLRQIRNGPKEE